MFNHTPANDATVQLKKKRKESWIPSSPTNFSFYIICKQIKSQKGFGCVTFFCSFYAHNGGDCKSFLTSLPVCVPPRAQQESWSISFQPWKDWK